MKHGKEDAVKQLIRKYSLANAVKFEGKANSRAVIGKLLAERVELRTKAQQIIELVNEIVEEVNQMSQDDQLMELRQIAPQLLESVKEHRVKDLPELIGAEKGKVVTRLPPEPSGYPHIGHAYAGYINWYYARKYGGKLILRFEDTNPRNVHPEYYEAFKEGYQWMEIDWDEELNVSDDLPYFYEKAEELLAREDAYFCSCAAETIKENRRAGNPCPHRQSGKEENQTIWNDILNGGYAEGEIVCRLRIDLKHPNAVMRDPNIFRIIDYPHPIQGNRYRLWPTYDFANSLEDHRNEITHVLRSNEFATRGELHAYIRELFGFPQPYIQEWSRFTIEGSPVSKRKIRPLIESGFISGWDDIRLTTLPALRNRGIIPEAVREMTREVGLSVAQPVLDWSVLLGINRRLVDPLANRYFCVTDPFLVKIRDIAPRTAVIPFHPDFKDRGTRSISVTDQVLIDGSDAVRLKKGDVFRLKHLYNLQVEKITAKFMECRFAGEELSQTALKIQWVSEDTVPVELRIPKVLFQKGEPNPESLQVVDGKAESSIKDAQLGSIIQLERKGFGVVVKNTEKVNINMTE
ncbi:MAG: glutamate--tRNA ligase [Candidatus Hodarchaeota archaeon]